MSKKRTSTKHKPRRKKQSALSKLIGSSKDAYIVKKRYMLDLNPRAIRESVGAVAGHPFFKEVINLRPVNDYSRIYVPKMPHFDLLRSVNWAAGVLLYNNDELSKFVELEGGLTRSILKEDYEAALASLDSIDDVCGISTWSVSVRGTILKLKNSYDGLQSFMALLYERSKGNNFFDVTCRHMSNRYDVVTLSESAALKSQLIRTFQPPLRSFLIYKHVPRQYGDVSLVDFNDVIGYEKNATLVDLFKSVTDLFIYGGGIQRNELAEVAVRLSKNIKHYFIRGIAASVGAEGDWRFDALGYEIIDLYSAGRYLEICQLANANAERYFELSIFELIAKAAARTDARPFSGLRGALLNDLVNIFRRDEGYQRSVDNVSAICHGFAWMPWFQELQLLVLRESISLGEPSYRELLQLSSMLSEIDSPRKVLALPPDGKEGFLESCKRAFPSSLSIKLFEALQTGDIGVLDDPAFLELEGNRRLKYKARILAQAEDLEAAIPILMALSSATDLLVAYDAKKALVNCYISAGMAEDALNVFVSAALENSNLIQGFDIERVTEVAKKLAKASLSIDVPLALSFFSRFVGPKEDAALRFSFERFLRNNRVKSPLDLWSLEGGFGKDRVACFLEKVCVPDVMKLSAFFVSYAEIEDCRVAICTDLINRGISKRALLEEMKQITKEQVLRRAARQVDRTRVYSDFSALRDQRSAKYRSVFDVYQQLIKHDYSTADDEKALEEVWSALPADLLMKAAHSVHLLKIALNEKNQTFYKLLNMCRDEFVFGKRGLNSHLSTRIRHGILPNALRKCASHEKLITAIQETTRLPKPNQYWRGVLVGANPSEMVIIEKALNKFTLQYEELISEINNQWLQVVSIDQDIQTLQEGHKTKALFDYSISNLETYAIQRMLDGQDYEHFVRVVTRWLWSRTDMNLSSVRESIGGEAKERFGQYFADLYESVHDAVGGNRGKAGVLLDAIIRGRDALFAALQTTISWFRKSETEALEVFEFGTLVEIAAKTANVPVVVTEGANIKFQGQWLSSLVDVFYILFENAQENANVERERLGLITNAYITSDGSLAMNITNNCGRVGDVTSANASLDYYRNGYGNEELIERVAQGEGGTGFFKIWNVLSRDMNIDHSFEFGFCEDGRFSVDLKILRAKGVVYEENSAHRGSAR